MTHDCLWAVMTLRAARFALGAESNVFGRTLNVRTSPPPSTVVDSAEMGNWHCRWEFRWSWRRGRDSNSRRAFTLAGFQDRCIQPLCHPSATGANLTGNSVSVNHRFLAGGAAERRHCIRLAAGYDGGSCGNGGQGLKKRRDARISRAVGKHSKANDE